MGLPRPRGRLRWSITMELTLCAALVIAAVTALSIAAGVLRERAVFTHEVDLRSATLATALNGPAADRIYRGDLDGLRQLALAVEAGSTVKHPIIFLPDGTVLAPGDGGRVDVPVLESVRKGEQRLWWVGDVPQFATPITRGEEVIGGAIWIVDWDATPVRINEEAVQRIWRGLAFIALGTIVFFLLARGLTRSLQRVVRAAGAVAAGRFEYTVGLPRDDEVGDLDRAFAGMTRSLVEWRRQAEERLVLEQAARQGLEVEVSRRRDAEEVLGRTFRAVEQAKREWEHTFDAIAGMVAVISPDHRIIRANRAVSTAQGWALEALPGAACYQALYGRESLCPGCPHERVARTRTEATMELHDLRGDRTYEATLFPQGDEVVAIVEVAQDVTVARRVREQVLQAGRLRVLGEIASGVAHDFNNVLSVILAQSELLLEQSSDPDLRRSLGIISQAAGDGAATVRRIRGFTPGRREEESVPVSLDRVVRESVDMSAPRWRRRRAGAGIEVRTVLAAARPALGRPAELREVLVNLLFNAAEAMPRGGTIIVRTWNTETAVYVSVSDTGIGMDEETKRQVFHPFFSTKGSAGSGLGMSVVYGIVNRLEGAITVESAPGAGTTITVVLPAARADYVRPAGREQQAAGQGKRWDVLVVDDDERLGRVFTQLLAGDHHEATLCTSGQQARDLLRQRSFDVVFTDLTMPDVSGWDIAAAAAALPRPPRVVLMTGWDVRLDEREMAASGVHAVLTKPFTLATLRNCLGSLLDRP